MKYPLPTLAIVTFLLTAAAVGLSAAGPGAAADAWADVWKVDEHRARMRTEDGAARELDRKTDLAYRRITLREHIVNELLAGRLTFDEAAAQFAEVTRQCPGATENVRMFYSGATEDERAAQHLIRYLRAARRPGAPELAAEAECVLASRQQPAY